MEGQTVSTTTGIGNCFACRSAGVAGRIWPRSSTNMTLLVGLVAVDEVTEALARLGIVDGLLPFAFVGVDHVLHVDFELRGDAELDRCTTTSFR